MSEEIRKVQHYHTKTANAEPSATNMLDGEIAVNMTADNEKLFIKNTDNEIVEFLPADKLATKTELSGKMDKVTLATVATSGSYNDLSNKPTIPTKTSDLTNDSNFGKVATFEWDGETMSGTLSQDKYNEIAAADIVYIELGDSKVYFTKRADGDVITLFVTALESSTSISNISIVINTDRTYTLSLNGVQIPSNISDLAGSENLLETTEIKTVNGEDIVKGTDGVTDIKTQLAYAEYTGTATAAVVTTKYGYFPTTLVEGASVAVKFEGSLTSITTLNVNGTGAKNVYYKGNSLTSGSISRYNTYIFVYDGSYYRIVGIDTDTHYTAKNVVTSSSTSKSNATATNGNVYLNAVENSAVRSTHKIVGTGATTVTSDSSGNITIDTPLKTINGESIVGSGDITIEGSGGNVYTWSVPANTTTGTVTPEEYTAIKEASQVYVEIGGVYYQASKLDAEVHGSLVLSAPVIMSDGEGNNAAMGLYFEILSDRTFGGGIFMMNIPTKTSQLTNDSNFVTYAEFEWDGSSEGTVTQDKFEEIRNADIVIVKQEDGDMIAHTSKTSGGAVIFYYSMTMNNITSSAMFIIMDYDYSWTCSTSQTTIPAAVTEATVSGWGFTKNTGTYSKPSGGIPKSDLASDVQNLLSAATTANTGVTKLVTGDLKDKTYTNGEAAAAAHTHSQYIKTNGNTSLGENEGGINIDGYIIDIYQGADVGVIISDETGDNKAQLYSYGNYVEATADGVNISGSDSSAVFGNDTITISTNETAISLGNSGFDIEVQEDGTDVIHTLTFNDLGSLKVNGKSVLTEETYKGTVTGVKINGSTKNPSNGIVDLGTVITAHQTLKTINNQSIIGSGNITIEGGSSNANVQAVATGDVVDDVSIQYATKVYVDTLVGDINSALESIINGGYYAGLMSLL